MQRRRHVFFVRSVRLVFGILVVYYNLHFWKSDIILLVGGKFAPPGAPFSSFSAVLAQRQ
jgi:hypothetical protein